MEFGSWKGRRSASSTTNEKPPVGWVGTNGRRKLIGRASEEQALLNAYYRQRGVISSANDTSVSSVGGCCSVDPSTGSLEQSQPPLTGGREIVLITGPSGAGKTMLAKSTLEQRVKEERGYFCYGKCDQIHNVTSVANGDRREEVEAKDCENDATLDESKVESATPACYVPFAPFRSAMSSLIDSIVRDDDTGEELVRIEEALEKATEDSSLNILLDMFPSFQKVINDESRGGALDGSLDGTTHHDIDGLGRSGITPTQPGGDDDSPKASSPSSPGITMFCEFMIEFVSTDHPVVLCLDDWQWMDPSSLELLKALVASFSSGTGKGTNNTSGCGLLLLGTCRGDEVSTNDPLSIALRSFEEEHGTTITDIQLASLSELQVEHMISSMLDPLQRRLSLPNLSKSDNLGTLATDIYQLTEGNPFCVYQYIRWLYETDLLYHDGKSWKWDEETTLADATRGNHKNSSWMLESTITSTRDNARISNHAVIEDILLTASCLGSSFSAHHLQIATSLSNHAPHHIDEALTILVERGVFREERGHATETAGTAASDKIRFSCDKESNCVSSRNPSHRCFRWTHDQFQQEAYSMIPDKRRKQFFIGIGRQLLGHLSYEEVSESSFLISNLYMQGGLDEFQDKERIAVARAFHFSGVKAARSSGFESAASFFRTGIKLLPSTDKDGIRQYCDTEEYRALYLQLYNAAMEMEVCTGRYGVADELFLHVMRNTTSLDDQIRAYESKITSLSSRRLDDDAIELGLKVLRLLGEKFPSKPKPVHSIVAIMKTMWRMRGKTATTILETIRPMRLWDKVASLRIMQLIFGPVMRSRPELSALLTTRGVDLTLRYGLSRTAEPVFIAFGMILGTVAVGASEDANRCAEIAAQLHERYHGTEWKARAKVMNFAYIQPWRLTFKSCLSPLLAGMRAGLVSGDIQSAHLNATLYILNSVFCGYGSLQDHLHMMGSHRETFSNLGQPMAYSNILIQLIGRCAVLTTLNEDFCEVKSSEEDTSIAETTTFRAFCGAEIAEDEARSGRKDDALLIYSLLCQCFHVLFTDSCCDRRESLELTRRIRKFPFHAMYGTIVVVEIYFLIGMIELVCAREVSTRGANIRASKKRVRQGRKAGQIALKNLRACADKMKFPENVFSKIHLIEAEICVQSNKKDDAQCSYQKAIRVANEVGVVQEEALAYERCGIALSEWGETVKASKNVEQAAKLYRMWGAHRKATRLEKLLPTLRNSQKLHISV